MIAFLLISIGLIVQIMGMLVTFQGMLQAMAVSNFPVFCLFLFLFGLSALMFRETWRLRGNRG